MTVQSPSESSLVLEPDLRALHRSMVRSRVLDDFVADLGRRGLVGLVAPARGYEAHLFGALAALRPTDWLFGDLRMGSSMLERGVAIRSWLAQLLGTGSSAHAGHASSAELTAREAHVVSVSSLMGTQLVHAGGLAMAMQRRQDDGVVLAWYGPSAAATGDAHNAMNFAGVYRLPVIFYYCTSGDPAADAQRIGGERYADRAEGYGFAGVTVDGSDVLAVMDAVSAAASRARAGGGATIIEGITGADPLASVEARLTADGVDVAAARREIAGPLQAELKAALTSLQAEGPPATHTLFDHVFAEPDARLREQHNGLARHTARFGDGTID